MHHRSIRCHCCRCCPCRHRHCVCQVRQRRSLSAKPPPVCSEQSMEEEFTYKSQWHECTCAGVVLLLPTLHAPAAAVAIFAVFAERHKGAHFERSLLLFECAKAGVKHKRFRWHECTCACVVLFLQRGMHLSLLPPSAQGRFVQQYKYVSSAKPPPVAVCIYGHVEYTHN